MEEWKDIVGYEGRYQVSNLGRVRNKELKLLSLQLNKNGYHIVTLFNGLKKAKLVHRLVMSSFVGLSDLQVNHKDFDKTNNRLDNLEYTTSKENITHFRTSNRIRVIEHTTKGSPIQLRTVAHLEFLQWLIKDIPKSDIDSIIKACYEYVNS